MRRGAVCYRGAPARVYIRDICCVWGVALLFCSLQAPNAVAPRSLFWILDDVSAFFRIRCTLSLIAVVYRPALDRVHNAHTRTRIVS
ncbi:hypothetical protein LXA43DRAFT_350338 [Ganoderma leucocontextum]|nr:hypothetical protein LXA43DRAFT_350338 [Ganoderma leucocontextum]